MERLIYAKLPKLKKIIVLCRAIYHIFTPDKIICPCCIFGTVKLDAIADYCQCSRCGFSGKIWEFRQKLREYAKAEGVNYNK
jgi:hypothetical protein